jgi:EmrB/QacA subfamily drug resistance transporter
MGQMMSRVWMVTAIGSVLGPVLGGVIVGGLGWRWIFVINVPIGIVVTVAAVHLLPDTPPRPAGRLDVSGLIRLSVGVPSIVFGLAQAERTGNPLSQAALVPLIVGVALLCEFVRHALRCDQPLLDLKLYARRIFATGSASLFCFNAAWFAVFILLPLYLQQVRHASPAVAGLLLAPQGVGTLAGSWCSGRIRDGARVTRLGALSALAFAATTIAFARIGPSSAYWLICSLLLLAGFAGGFAWVAATATGYAELAPDEISHASPLVTTVMRLGASVGTALAAIVLARELRGGTGAGSQAHLVAAYHSSFQWAASAALLALVTFVALCRSEPRWGAIVKSVLPSRS